MKAGKLKDIIITSLIKVCGYSAIIFVGLIFIFLIKEGSPALIRVPLGNFLQLRWYPIEDRFGLLPLIGGSLIVTLGAAIFSVPLGLVSAVYIAEVAPRWAREILKPLVEVLGGLPSVMLGFIGILVIVPALRQALNLPTGLTAFTGALILGGMAIPTI
ncbi:MAG: phosphate ABC transporter permease subunit PstC, partial [Chloroflexi bacterium]|nr:phosphate ABC transporter permease subunit PstC [Chloroflexota bacterium]